MLTKMAVSDQSGSPGYDQNGNDNATPQPPPSQLHQHGESSKQNSIFSLTLDEIQSKSGKNYGSMNMDEFLANILSVDENQVTLEQPNQGDHEDLVNGKDTAAKPSLPRQGSFSIPTPLCKKTVDEVWSEIDKTRPPPPPNDIMSISGPPQRQQTIGEITLEDFLVKAGVVQESPYNHAHNIMESTTVQPQGGGANNYSMAISSSTYEGTSFGMGSNVIGSGFLYPQDFVPNNLSGNGYATYPMFGQSKLDVGEASYGGTSSANEKCNSLRESSGTNNKKKIIDGPPEVLVERRQRRMIKNRESAARSRARKQAYTVELEAEVNQLQDENTKLKQIVAEIEQRRKQEALNRKQTTRAQQLAAKLRTVRRTISA